VQNNNCPLQQNEGADLILDYCSNRLEADQVLAFERHLRGCEECTRVVDAQRSVWEALDHFEAMPVSEDFDEKLWKRIEATEARPWWRKLLDGPALGWSSVFSWKPAMVTASACAAVLAVMVFTTPNSPSTSPGQGPVIVEKAMIERVDLDQIEGAIDDLDMLQQLGVVDDVDKSNDPA
jgi:anti-sigma-K factor RskA